MECGLILQLCFRPEDNPFSPASVRCKVLCQLELLRREVGLVGAMVDRPNKSVCSRVLWIKTNNFECGHLSLPDAMWRRMAMRNQPTGRLFAVALSKTGCGEGGYFSLPQQTYVITVTLTVQ